jgi:hypothetical protein
MNPASPANPLWQQHLDRLQRLHGRIPAKQRQVRTHRPRMSDDRAEETRRGERTARPPGRLGRRLLAEIEPYLELFAIARGRQALSTGMPVPPRSKPPRGGPDAVSGSSRRTRGAGRDGVGRSA